MSRKKQPELLFDIQGPRNRRQMNILTAAVFALILLLACVATWQLYVNGALEASRWASVFAPAVSLYLLGGLGLSLFSGLVAGLLAAPLGIALTIARLAKNRVVSTLARWWTELTRAIPVLLVIYFVQLLLPILGLRTPVFWQLVLPLALYHIAILAEIFRAGVESVPKGQREAAESLGFHPLRIYQLVVLPQAIRIVLPTLITQFIRLFKDTTFGFIVTYPELLTRGKIIGEYTGNLLQTYTVVLAVYLVVDLILAAAARMLDRRMRAPSRSRTAGRQAATVLTTQSLIVAGSSKDSRRGAR